MSSILRTIRRTSFWLHLGFACAVAGLALTRIGRRLDMLPPPIEIDLAPGEAMQVEDAVVALKRFRVPRYESGKPKQFVSDVHYMAEGARGSVENVEISVNHPLVRGGWWIYQSGWGEDARGEYTVLKCVRDPFLPLAFAGWAMMLLGAAMLAVKWWRLAVAEEKGVCPVSHPAPPKDSHPPAGASDPSRPAKASDHSPHPGVLDSGLPAEALDSRPSVGWIREWWPYGAAVAVSAVPVYFIGRSVLRPDLVPALQSPLLFPHILAYLFSYVVFLFAAFGLLRRLWGAAFFLMTLGLVLGALWGKICWSEWWQFDPKEMWSLCTWLAYGLFFHIKFLPAKTPQSRRSLERILLRIGAALILLTLLWVNFSRLFSGLHAYA